jgi:hypothetical protein
VGVGVGLSVGAGAGEAAYGLGVREGVGRGAGVVAQLASSNDAIVKVSNSLRNRLFLVIAPSF